jgi:phosphomevalonate kinase
VKATAPGKLILTGEYAVLDGAPALVLAVDRRVVATRRTLPRGSSPFLVAVADEIARRLGAEHPATRAALEIVVDSTAFYQGTQKLGLGSSAAVTVAATALALAADHERVPLIDKALVLEIASAAHATAQGPRGARGSGADIAASVHGGVIAFQRATPDRIAWPSDAAQAGTTMNIGSGTADRLTWPANVTLIPFFTGASADTPQLVAAVQTARERDRVAVEAALAAIDKASRAACQACAMRAPEIASNALIAAISLAAHATDQLAAATGVPLVPGCVTAARALLARLGGTAKTTGAGGGDIGIAVLQRSEDVTTARRYLIEAGCQPLPLSVDTTGVDLQPSAQ